MKIIQHFPYSVTLPEIIDRQRRGVAVGTGAIEKKEKQR